MSLLSVDMIPFDGAVGVVFIAPLARSPRMKWSEVRSQIVANPLKSNQLVYQLDVCLEFFVDCETV